MIAASSRGRFVLPVFAVILVTAGLGGCVEQMAEVQVGNGAVGSGSVRNAIARGQLTSPRAATVAIVSLEGAPPAVEDQFRKTLATEAASREIAITDVASARYLVRGYLAAYPGGQGVQVAYTYDVFDAGAKQRRQRISDTIDVPGDGGDPWAAVTATVLASVTSRSADDLALSLGGTPEAQATAGAIASGPQAAAVSAPVD